MYLDGIFEMWDLFKKKKPIVEKKQKKAKTPKELATDKGEPWVGVLDTKVNIENPRNGFFELDWNEQFIAVLKAHGYHGDNDEEIVDSWFKDLCKNILAEEGLDESRNSGYINVVQLTSNKSEVS